MILKNATRREVETLGRLRHGDFSPLLELLSKAERDMLGRLTKADDVAQIHRLQGAVAFLQDFLQAVDKAPEHLSRMNSGPGRP